MRTDGRRELRRPAGAVLRPLGLLVAAVASGFGMWHALMQDAAVHADRTALRETAQRQSVDRPRQ